MRIEREKICSLHFVTLYLIYCLGTLKIKPLKTCSLPPLIMIFYICLAKSLLRMMVCCEILIHVWHACFRGLSAFFTGKKEPLDFFCLIGKVSQNKSCLALVWHASTKSKSSKAIEDCYHVKDSLPIWFKLCCLHCPYIITMLAIVEVLVYVPRKV